MKPGQTRDVVVIGSSMGGVHTLSALMPQLPADLPASILIVQHIPEQSPAVLSEILSGRGPLPAVRAEDGMTLDRGRIYVAPPGRHLILTEAGIRLVFGPRENRSRPAIDPLFRTAAVNYRSRVIGVILTGLLGDGAAGLRDVEVCGGVALVQSPEDAAYPEMPTRALAATGSARPVTIDQLGAVLDGLTREPAPDPPPVPAALRAEARLTERAMNDESWEQLPGDATNFTCPDCRGAMREISTDGTHRYRCRVGHAFTLEGMATAKEEAIEEALWLAMQTLKERTQMLESMARQDRERGRSDSAENFDERAREARSHAERLGRLVSKVCA
ncbi:MAG: chemotaxis protein CheB [Gemmatimonadota bacterium]